MSSVRRSVDISSGRWAGNGLCYLAMKLIEIILCKHVVRNLLVTWKVACHNKDIPVIVSCHFIDLTPFWISFTDSYVTDSNRISSSYVPIVSYASSLSLRYLTVNERLCSYLRLSLPLSCSFTFFTLLVSSSDFRSGPGDWCLVSHQGQSYKQCRTS